MAMLNGEMMGGGVMGGMGTEEDYKPIIFECFSSLESLQRSFKGVRIQSVEAQKLTTAVYQDLERAGLLSVVTDEVLQARLRRDVAKRDNRKKKTGLVDEDFSRQPSKGKIYGRKFNGRFASKAIYNYHNKKKALEIGDEEKRGSFEGHNSEEVSLNCSSSYEEEDYSDTRRELGKEQKENKVESTRTDLNLYKMYSQTEQIKSLSLICQPPTEPPLVDVPIVQPPPTNPPPMDPLPYGPHSSSQTAETLSLGVMTIKKGRKRKAKKDGEFLNIHFSIHNF